MPPSLLLGVELPPVPGGARSAGFEGASHSVTEVGSAPPTVDLGPWWEAARAATDAGAGVVWFTTALSHASASCDPCTLAAAAVDRIAGVHLGVVSGVPVERHPGVLAREVTALDVVSGGRAAVLLQWASPERSLGLAEASEQYAEAVAVCSAVLRDENPVFEGRHYHVAGAVNRPPPVQAGGPPVFAAGPAGPAALAAARDATGFGALRLVLRAASAVVCSDDAADVAMWKTAIEEATAVEHGATTVSPPPALVCRTTTRVGARVSTGGGAAPGAGVGDRLRAARDAGADGVIVRIPPSRRLDMSGTSVGGSAGPAPPMPVDLAPVLAERFAPWID